VVDSKPYGPARTEIDAGYIGDTDCLHVLALTHPHVSSIELDARAAGHRESLLMAIAINDGKRLR
jgi:hypothetical protein